jgi:thymidylate kinase
MHSVLPLPAPLSTDHNGAAPNSTGVLEHSPPTPLPVLPLVSRLCRALEEEGISYCHWKSNNALDRSATGENDLDLLVSRADTTKFTALLWRLGFKQVKTPAERYAPGVLDYFGYDEQAAKLVHVHVHYQLSLGHDLTKNYRLPIEKAYLESSVQGELFRVPEAEFEFIVFVIRMILKHSTWDVMLWGEGRLKASERRELAWLLDRIDPTRVNLLVQQHLPCISAALFSDCTQALQPASSAWIRMRTGQQLQKALQANARRPLLSDTYHKLWRRGVLAIRRRVFHFSPKYSVQNGGITVALVGGDGAGKSTAVDAVYEAFCTHFAVTRIHMGKPAWSALTITIRAILKTGQVLGLYPVESSFRETLLQRSPVSPGYPWLVREACTARDRYWNYMMARRAASEGAIVLFDRFPLPQVQLKDGPQGARFVGQLMERPRSKARFQPHKDSRLTRSIIKLEQSYYNQILPPDLLIVLRLEPQIAVQRKTDEDPSSVRERSTAIWEVDWAQTAATVVDASKSKNEVAAELTARIWTQL